MTHAPDERLNEDLLPCPFCGGRAELEHDTPSQGVFALGCTTDGCAAVMMWAGEDMGYLNEATAAWNQRSAVPEAHPDDLAVDRFAVAMKAKLAKKRDEGRGGWDDKTDCTAEFLSQLLREHVEKGDPIDVGNLAMMLHQRGESIVHVSFRSECAPAALDEELRRGVDLFLMAATIEKPNATVAASALYDAYISYSKATLCPCATQRTFSDIVSARYQKIRGRTYQWQGLSLRASAPS